MSLRGTDAAYVIIRLRAPSQPAFSKRNSVMKPYIPLALFGALALPMNAHAQHKFVYRAELTQAGVKDLQMRTAKGLRANIIKATESVGCKQEYWYIEPLTSIAYGGVDCPSEAAPVAVVTTVNAAGFARLTYRSVLTAEQMDEQMSKNPNYKAPQNQ
jgi:hypothetical protein